MFINAISGQGITLKQRAKILNDLTLNIGIAEGVASQETFARLDAILAVIYLIFTEGYLSHSPEFALRRDLCEQAIRLAKVLARNPFFKILKGKKSESNNLDGVNPALMALLALMTFNLARFNARQNATGQLILLQEQDRSQWRPELIAQGFLLFTGFGRRPAFNPLSPRGGP